MGIITLAEAKAQLNLVGDGDDEELQAYIDGITAPIENLVGVVEQREFTETVNGTGRTLCLLKLPAIALVAVTPQLTGGAALDVGQLHLDGATGIVQRLSGARFHGGPWTFTYTAGRAEELPTIKLAARMLIQHLWRTQTASRGPVLAGGDDFSVTEQVPGFGYAVPNRVLQLLEPYKLPPAVA
ncbi:head-tail connector protein [Streptomyces sp. NPDC050264]|uniref:head-tail connector protein n=1 Tax=Streptomyces sp. NPDC050264 TaxID=3155038 RepID=UPI003427EBBF